LCQLLDVAYYFEASKECAVKSVFESVYLGGAIIIAVIDKGQAEKVEAKGEALIRLDEVAYILFG